MSSKSKIFKCIGLSAFLGTSILLTVPNNSRADHETGHFPVCPGSSSDLSSLIGNGGSGFGFIIKNYKIGCCLDIHIL